MTDRIEEIRARLAEIVSRHSPHPDGTLQISTRTLLDIASYTMALEDREEALKLKALGITARWMKRDEMLLLCGEMTPGEIRTVRSVVSAIMRSIAAIPLTHQDEDSQ